MIVLISKSAEFLYGMICLGFLLDLGLRFLKWADIEFGKLETVIAYKPVGKQIYMYNMFNIIRKT